MGGTIIRVPFHLRRAKRGYSGPEVTPTQFRDNKPKQYRCACGESRNKKNLMCFFCKRDPKRFAAAVQKHLDAAKEPPCPG